MTLPIIVIEHRKVFTTESLAWTSRESLADGMFTVTSARHQG